MKNLDDALQQNLEALENGVPVPEVLSRLSSEDAELAPLIQLAGGVHSTIHPQANTARAMEDKRKMNAALKAQRTTRGRWFSMPVMLGAAAVMVALIIGLVSVFSAPASNTAQIANVSGLVEVASSDTAEDWRIVSSGDTVKAGERLRTYDGSSVTLAFYEGSYTMLGPNADMTLATLDGGRGGTIDVDLLQRAGRTNHRVVPFDGKNSSFVVQTPNGQARVHGTSFAVAVDPVGKALFSVTTGKVEVNSGSAQVFLLPGQASLASAEIGLEDPAYTFSLRGAVQEMGATSWKVDGVTVMVNEQTQITGSPVLGSIVEVGGRILEGNVWQADSIVLVTETEPQPNLLTYTGVVNSMGASEWQVGSATVQVNSATMIDPDIQTGDVAKVTFQVLEDGSWLAVSIDKMGEEEPLPTETPVPTSIAPASDLVFQPGSAEMYGCAGDGFSTEGTLVNTGAVAVSNVRLEVLVTDGAGYVESATVSPERIDSIGAGGSAGFSVNVDMNGNWATAVDQTVNVRVLLSHTTNGPVQENAQFDFTIHSGCEATPTGTPVTTLTPGATPEAPPSVCTGAEPQPTGMRLAAEFGVPYEEIMGWFCQNFGFGEIKSAYEMSRASGVPVEDIFTMRRSGMGWGNIKKLVENASNPSLTGTPEPPKGNDKDNPGKGPDKVKPEKTKKPNPNKKP